MKIKFGALVTDGRGKIGGHVASKNRGGAYLKTKVTPANPRTSYQSSVRARLASLAAMFATLTQEQIAGWNSAVTDWSKTDIFGDLKNPSGLNLFVKLNANILGVGGSIISAVPTKGEIYSAPELVISSTAGSVTIAEPADAPNESGIYCLIKGTPGYSAGKSNVKNKFRTLNSTATSEISWPVNAEPLITARFGAINAGDKVSVGVQFVNVLTGQSGVTTFQSVIVS